MIPAPHGEQRASGPVVEHRNAMTQAMSDARLDALLVHGTGAVGQYGDIAYLTGWVPDNRGMYALARPGRNPLVLAIDRRQAEAFAQTPQLSGADLVVMPKATNLPEAVASAVAMHARDGRVGLGPTVPAATAQQIRRQPSLNVDPAEQDLISRLRDHLSGTDRHAMRATARILDEALLQFRDFAQPGMTEIEAAARIEAHLVVSGSVLRIVHVAAGHFHGQRPQPHPIASGDAITVFAESAGPSGHWVETGAVFHLGEVDPVRHAMSEITVEAIRAGSLQIRPGAAVAEAAHGMQAQLGSSGTPTISLGHGVGVDESAWTLDPASHRTFSSTGAVAVHPSHQPSNAKHIAVAAANTILIDDARPEPLSQLPFRIHRIPVA